MQQIEASSQPSTADAYAAQIIIPPKSMGSDASSIDNIIIDHKKEFTEVDLISNSESAVTVAPEEVIATELPPSTILPISSMKPISFKKKMQHSDSLFNVISNGLQQFFSESQIWLFLTLLAFTVGTISYLQDILIQYMFIGRNQMLQSLITQQFSLPFQVFCYVSYNLLFVLISVSLVILFAPQAEGSGVSTIRALLNDCKTVPKRFLAFKTLVIKVIALPLAVGSQIFLGKTGPMVHTAAAVSSCMLQFRIFKNLKQNKTLVLYLLQMSCAVGIAANFQSPIAGVLLSVEILTYFNYKIYIKTFYASILTTVIVKVYRALLNQETTLSSVWKTGFFQFEIAYHSIEVLFFILLGILIGFLAPLYSFFAEQLFQLKVIFGKKRFVFFSFHISHSYLDWMFKFTETRFWYTLVVSIFTSLVCMPYLIGPYLSLTVSNTLEDLFFVRDLTIDPSLVDNPHVNWTSKENPWLIFQNLILFCTFRLVISLFSFPISCPGGLFTPSVIIGAGLGRLYGECLHVWFPWLEINPGGYSIVGAAAFSSCFLQAFSCVFIILEIVGNSFYIPSLIAGIVGMIVAKHMGSSAYDSIAKVYRFHFLSEIKADHIDTQKCVKFMKSVNQLCLTETMTCKEIEQRLQKFPTLPRFPIISSVESAILLGDVSREMLKQIVEQQVTTLNPIFIPFQSVTVTLDEEGDVTAAHKLFSIFHVDQLYVCSRAKIIGYIARDDFIVLNNEFRPTVYEVVSNFLDQKIFRYA